MTKKKGYSILINYLKFHKRIFTNFSSILMDIYTLARMMYYDSDEVITYTGHNHSKRYIEFFQLYLHINPIFSIDMTHINNLEHRYSVNRCIESDLLSQYIPIDTYLQYHDLT